jgi:hypothetical protein
VTVVSHLIVDMTGNQSHLLITNHVDELMDHQKQNLVCHQSHRVMR